MYIKKEETKRGVKTQNPLEYSKGVPIESKNLPSRKPLF